MSTFKEENAITYRIAQMQVQWQEAVTKETQLIRWLVKKDEIKMIKAFHRLESSEHGKLPDLFLNFEQAFGGIDTYGKELVESWIALWNDEQSRKEVESANVLPNWDDSTYHSVAEKNSIWSFMLCMSSFAKAIDSKTTIVLGLLPHGNLDITEFVDWTTKCLKSLPANLKIAVIDLKDNQKFDNLPNYINEVTIEPNLKMHEAMKEIVSAGDTNNPTVGVNLCLLNIGEAINNNDKEQIHHWGKEGIKIAKETGLPSIEATVCIAYGSALYQLKKFDDALALFKKAEKASIEGLQSDPTAATLLLQSYNIQASTFLYKRKYTKAYDYYIKTAKEAYSQKNTMMQIEACRQAAFCAVKNGEKEEAYTLLQEAYAEGKKMEIQTQKFSSMLLISVKLYEFADDNKDEKLQKEIVEYATEIWGEHWQNISQEEVYKQILTT